LRDGEPPVRYLLHRMSREALHAAITEPLHLAASASAIGRTSPGPCSRTWATSPANSRCCRWALWRTWSEARGQGPDLVRAYYAIGRVEGAWRRRPRACSSACRRRSSGAAETLFVRAVRPAGGRRRHASGRASQGVRHAVPGLADELSKEERWRLLPSASARSRSRTVSSPPSGSGTSVGSQRPGDPAMVFRPTRAATTSACCSR
jgi:hypothetical protein